ncbi:ribonuclease H-like domain-containing protein [Mycena pura]|uniref:Ribonuclease H-like domain-containing protein n=1 Tax=Mycena pura TaxID=153505 RepID=A0AAD6VJR4_9AGAR|nr:ribonuclease H-like domain-containing protein [Mycena pura]
MKRSGTYIVDGWEDELRRSLYGSAVARVGEPSIIMGLQDLTGHRGSAEKILDASEVALSEMCIENASCLLAAVTDDPNVMKAFRRLFEQRYPWIITLACWVHQENTMIGEICRYPAAKAALQKANRVVTFFNGSHYWGGQLKIAAVAEKVTRGLKKNCESRWYALILLALSITTHQTPLSTLVARPEARKPTDGYSAINVDVIRIVQDIDDEFWPWLDQVIRVARPFVDAIAESEGRGVNLADCMLNLLKAAYQLSKLEIKTDDSAAFKAHAYAVVDKRFRKMATPIHRLALFLHPLCRKFAAVDSVGFTLRDLKITALTIAKDKWNWTADEARLLVSDMDDYHACKDPFAGGDKDSGSWWKALTVSSKAHPLKPFAVATLSIVPHSAEIERLFSSCNGIQSPKRNSLAVETFSKLAKVRSSLVEEAKTRAPAKQNTKANGEKKDDGVESSATRHTAEKSTPLGNTELLEKRSGPMDGMSEDDPVGGVDSVFHDLDRQLEEEDTNQLSLMGGDIYDFALVKKALDNVVPQEKVQKVDVVRQTSQGDWNIEDIL